MVAPIQYSQLLWAILYGHLWFDETPTRSVLLGAAIIVLAGLLIVWREASSGVSRNRPFLRTRNLRPSPAPMRPVESDEREAAAETKSEAGAQAPSTKRPTE